MNLAVTDACIFIDLFELDLTTHFFSLSYITHTSSDVFSELYNEQKQFFSTYQLTHKLVIHLISEDNRKSLLKKSFPTALSDIDKTALYIAGKMNALVLSSDKIVRNCAKDNCVGCHGIIWILDRLLEAKQISKKEATLKLKQLINTNLVYQNNSELLFELEKRLRIW